MAALFQNPIPKLRNGDHLSRPEFERRYWPMTEVKKAELIEGIVYMPERVPVTTHGEPHASLCGWLVNYCLKIPELRAANSSSCRLDDRNEFQPDLLVLLSNSHGGTAIVDEDDFVLGARFCRRNCLQRVKYRTPREERSLSTQWRERISRAANRGPSRKLVLAAKRQLHSQATRFQQRS